MIGFIFFIHIISCALLVIAILMQAGKGGGLTESFQSAESVFGTQTNAFMIRFTTILAVIFLSTSLFLAVNSSKSEKSLMSNKKLLSTVPNTQPAPKSEGQPQIKIEPFKPVTAAPSPSANEAATVTNAAK